MAYTLPVLDVTPVRAACYLVDPANIADDAPLTAPLTAANLPRVLWHSDFQYLEVKHDVTVTLHLPFRSYADRGAGTEAVVWDIDGAPVPFSSSFAEHALLTDGTLSGVPFVMCQIDGRWLYDTRVFTSGPIVNETSGGIRSLAIEATATGVVARENWVNLLSFVNPYPRSAVPAQTLIIRLIVFAVRVPVSGADLMDLNGASGAIQLGRGLLDTNNLRGFLREIAGGMPLPIGRTLDSVPGALRRWNLDGTTTDLVGTYAGGYGGPAVRYVGT